MYCPTAQLQVANDALMVQGHKHMAGISRHAHNDALWGPKEHDCHGLTRSSHSRQAAVAREWVWHGAWAKEGFHEYQTYTLWALQALKEGCPAVLTLGQCTHHPWCPYLIATLQRVVNEVSLPMWMPGPYSGTTPILVRSPRGPRAGAVVAPAPKVARHRAAGVAPPTAPRQ